MGNTKKFLSLILAIVMIAGFSVSGGASFSDVPSASPYFEAIDQLQRFGILGGDEAGRFNPAELVTRAEFLKILYTVATGTPEAGLYSGNTVFTDVGADKWFSGYVNWAYANGIVGGRGDGSFGPELPVTIQEAVKMFVVAITGKADYAWPYGYITAAKQRGLLNKLTEVSIASGAQRQVVAQMAYNMLYIPTAMISSGGGPVRSPIEALFNIKESDETIILFGTSRNTRNGTGQTLISAPGQVSLGVITGIGDTAEIDACVFDYAGDVEGLIGAPVKVYYEEGTDEGWRNAKKIIDIQPGYALKTETAYNAISGSASGGKYIYTIGGAAIKLEEEFDFKSNFMAASADGGYRIGNLQYCYSSTAYEVYSDETLAVNPLEYLRTATTKEPLTFFDIDGDNKFDFISGNFTLSAMRVGSVSTITGRVALGQSLGSVEPYGGGIIKLANIEGYTGINVGDYVNGTLRVDHKGEFIYDLTPSTVRKNVTYTGANSDGKTVRFDGAALSIGYTNIDHGALASVYSRSPAKPNYANIGKKFDIVLTADGRLAVAAFSAESSAASGLNTAVVAEIGRDDSIVPNYNITLKLPDGTLKDYPLAAGAKLYNNGLEETLNNPTVWGNGWIKSGADTAGELSANIIISGGKAAIVGSVVHYELNASEKISVLTNLEEISSKLPSGAAGLTVIDDTNQSWSSARGAFIGEEHGYTFPDENLVAYKIVDGEYKAFTLKDLPDFKGAQVMSILNGEKVIAMIFDAWVPYTPVALTNVGTVSGYSIEAGLSSGRARFNVSAIIEGTQAQYYTEEFAIADTDSLKAEIDGAMNYMAAFQFTADNLIKNIKTLKVSSADGDFTYAVIAARMNNFYSFKPVYKITSDSVDVAQTASGYIMAAASEAKVYVVDAKPSEATAVEVLTGAKIGAKDVRVGQISDILFSEEPEAQYVVAYTTKMLSGITVLDTVVVYTKYIAGNAVPFRTLDSFTISGQPYKTAYLEGEVFDPAGMTLSANYSDGVSINVTGFTIELHDSADNLVSRSGLRLEDRIYVKYEGNLIRVEEIDMSEVCEGSRLLGSYTSNLARTDNSSMYITSPGNVFLTGLNDDSITNIIQAVNAGSVYSYAGDVEELIGLPVKVVYTDIGKTSIKRIEELGSVLYLRGEDLSAVDGHYYVDGTEEITFEADFYSGQKLIYQGTGTAGRWWGIPETSSDLLFNNIGDDIISLCDIDEDGDIDYGVVKIVMSGARLTALNVSEGYFSSTLTVRNSAWFTARTNERFVTDEDRLEIGDWVDITYRYDKNKNRIYCLSKSAVVENVILTGVIDGSTFEFGTAQYKTGTSLVTLLTSSAAAQEAEDAAAIEPLKAANIGKTFTLVLDQTGYIIRAIVDPLEVTAIEGVNGIAITTSPATTTYTAGNTFNPAGMVVTATFTDASTRVLSSSEYSWYIVRDGVKTSRRVLVPGDKVYISSSGFRAEVTGLTINNGTTSAVYHLLGTATNNYKINASDKMYQALGDKCIFGAAWIYFDRSTGSNLVNGVSSLVNLAGDVDDYVGRFVRVYTVSEGGITYFYRLTLSPYEHQIFRMGEIVGYEGVDNDNMQFIFKDGSTERFRRYPRYYYYNPENGTNTSFSVSGTNETPLQFIADTNEDDIIYASAPNSAAEPAYLYVDPVVNGGRIGSITSTADAYGYYTVTMAVAPVAPLLYDSNTGAGYSSTADFTELKTKDIGSIASGDWVDFTYNMDSNGVIYVEFAAASLVSGVTLTSIEDGEYTFSNGITYLINASSESDSAAVSSLSAANIGESFDLVLDSIGNIVRASLN